LRKIVRCEIEGENVADDAVRDIFVIGGGINGCGIARDAAGRGYSVVLAEMKDFASGTSSASTKLIHGGLRYLEHYEFRLVREALMEREILWAMAPHVIWPMRFVLPFHKGGIRPAWLIRLGLFLYDHIGGRKLLPATRTLDMRSDPSGKPLKKLFQKAFEYSDGWVDDARLVVLNARDAADRGADIRVGTRVVSARRENAHWDVETENVASGERDVIRARMLVNATGPWVDKVLAGAFGQQRCAQCPPRPGQPHRRPAGSSPTRQALLFLPESRRADHLRHPLSARFHPDRHHRPRLCRRSEAMLAISRRGDRLPLPFAASEYFKSSPMSREDDVVWTYSGVRPLYRRRRLARRRRPPATTS
jgi:glycerol-3-phosphate dehydrogenase